MNKSEYIKRQHRIFIATDADNLGASVERAALSNDIRKIRTMDRIIREGQQVIRDWAKRYKGIVFIDGGDDIAMFVDRRRFHEDDDKSLHVSLERLRKEYHKVTGYTVTIGLGETPSKAAQAMVYGKLQGKDRIQDWSKEAGKAVGGHKETPEEKYRKEGLVKDESHSGECVVVAVRHPILDNLYLHGRRMDDQKWALPAGQVLEGETHDEAASRILADEFGVHPESMQQIGSNDEGHTWLFVAVGAPHDASVALMDGAQYNEVRYIDPTGKNCYHVDKNHNALSQYIKEKYAPGQSLEFTNRGGFDKRKTLDTSPDGQVVKSELKKNVSEEKVKEAGEEIDQKSLEQIQRETAIKWASRACAAYKNLADSLLDVWEIQATEYAHEAIEHAALCEDEGVLESVRKAINKYKGQAQAARDKNAAKEFDKSELSKGSRQAKMPFNPQTDVSEPQQNAIRQWTRNAIPNARDFDIKPMTGNMRQRALSRITAKTVTRKNPQSGENEYLMHRGMGPQEHSEAVKDNKYHTWRRSSWSLDPLIAESFPKELGENQQRKIVSAWIPESSIVHYPKMAGQPSSFDPSKHTNALYGGEEEVIAEKQRPYQVATPEELSHSSRWTISREGTKLAQDFFRQRLNSLRGKYNKAEMPLTREQRILPSHATAHEHQQSLDDAQNLDQTSMAQKAAGMIARSKVPPVDRKVK